MNEQFHTHASRSTQNNNINPVTSHPPTSPTSSITASNTFSFTGILPFPSAQIPTIFHGFIFASSDTQLQAMYEQASSLLNHSHATFDFILRSPPTKLSKSNTPEQMYQEIRFLNTACTSICERLTTNFLAGRHHSSLSAIFNTFYGDDYPLRESFGETINYLLRIHLTGCIERQIPLTTPDFSRVTRLLYLLLTRTHHPRLALFFSECIHLFDYFATCLRVQQRPGKLGAAHLLAYDSAQPQTTCLSPPCGGAYSPLSTPSPYSSSSQQQQQQQQQQQNKKQFGHPTSAGSSTGIPSSAHFKLSGGQGPHLHSPPQSANPRPLLGYTYQPVGAVTSALFSCFQHPGHPMHHSSTSEENVSDPYTSLMSDFKFYHSLDILRNISEYAVSYNFLELLHTYIQDVPLLQSILIIQRYGLRSTEWKIEQSQEFFKKMETEEEFLLYIEILSIFRIFHYVDSLHVITSLLRKNTHLSTCIEQFFTVYILYHQFISFFQLEVSHVYLDTPALGDFYSSSNPLLSYFGYFPGQSDTYQSSVSSMSISSSSTAQSTRNTGDVHAAYPMSSGGGSTSSSGPTSLQQSNTVTRYGVAFHLASLDTLRLNEFLLDKAPEYRQFFDHILPQLLQHCLVVCQSDPLPPPPQRDPTTGVITIATPSSTSHQHHNTKDKDVERIHKTVVTSIRRIVQLYHINHTGVINILTRQAKVNVLGYLLNQNQLFYHSSIICEGDEQLSYYFLHLLYSNMRWFELYYFLFKLKCTARPANVTAHSSHDPYHHQHITARHLDGNAEETNVAAGAAAAGDSTNPSSLSPLSEKDVAILNSTVPQVFQKDATLIEKVHHFIRQEFPILFSVILASPQTVTDPSNCKEIIEMHTGIREKEKYVQLASHIQVRFLSNNDLDLLFLYKYIVAVFNRLGISIPSSIDVHASINQLHASLINAALRNESAAAASSSSPMAKQAAQDQSGGDDIRRHPSHQQHQHQHVTVGADLAYESGYSPAHSYLSADVSSSLSFGPAHSAHYPELTQSMSHRSISHSVSQSYQEWLDGTRPPLAQASYDGVPEPTSPRASRGFKGQQHQYIAGHTIHQSKNLSTTAGPGFHSNNNTATSQQQQQQDSQQQSKAVGAIKRLIHEDEVLISKLVFQFESVTPRTRHDTQTPSPSLRKQHISGASLSTAAPVGLDNACSVTGSTVSKPISRTGERPVAVGDDDLHGNPNTADMNQHDDDILASFPSKSSIDPELDHISRVDVEIPENRWSLRTYRRYYPLCIYLDCESTPLFATNIITNALGATSANNTMHQQQPQSGYSFVGGNQPTHNPLLGGGSGGSAYPSNQNAVNQGTSNITLEIASIFQLLIGDIVFLIDILSMTPQLANLLRMLFTHPKVLKFGVDIDTLFKRIIKSFEYLYKRPDLMASIQSCISEQVLTDEDSNRMKLVSQLTNHQAGMYDDHAVATICQCFCICAPLVDVSLLFGYIEALETNTTTLKNDYQVRYAEMKKTRREQQLQQRKLQPSEQQQRREYRHSSAALDEDGPLPAYDELDEHTSAVDDGIETASQYRYNRYTIPNQDTKTLFNKDDLMKKFASAQNYSSALSVSSSRPVSAISATSLAHDDDQYPISSIDAHPLRMTLDPNDDDDEAELQHRHSSTGENLRIQFGELSLNRKPTTGNNAQPISSTPRARLGESYTYSVYGSDTPQPKGHRRVLSNGHDVSWSPMSEPASPRLETDHLVLSGKSHAHDDTTKVAKTPDPLASQSKQTMTTPGGDTKSCMVVGVTVAQPVALTPTHPSSATQQNPQLRPSSKLKQSHQQTLRESKAIPLTTAPSTGAAGQGTAPSVSAPLSTVTATTVSTLSNGGQTSVFSRRVPSSAGSSNSTSSFLSVSTLRAMRLPPKHRQHKIQKIGLSRTVSTIFQSLLFKGVQSSNWFLRPLLYEQEQYAAIDVYILRKVVNFVANLGRVDDLLLGGVLSMDILDELAQTGISTHNEMYQAIYKRTLQQLNSNRDKNNPNQKGGGNKNKNHHNHNNNNNNNNNNNHHHHNTITTTGSTTNSIAVSTQHQGSGDSNGNGAKLNKNRRGKNKDGNTNNSTNPNTKNNQNQPRNAPNQKSGYGQPQQQQPPRGQHSQSSGDYNHQNQSQNNKNQPNGRRNNNRNHNNNHNNNNGHHHPNNNGVSQYGNNNPSHHNHHHHGNQNNHENSHHNNSYHRRYDGSRGDGNYYQGVGHNGPYHHQNHPQHHHHSQNQHQQQNPLDYPSSYQKSGAQQQQHQQGRVQQPPPSLHGGTTGSHSTSDQNYQESTDVYSQHQQHMTSSHFGHQHPPHMAHQYPYDAMFPQQPYGMSAQGYDAQGYDASSSRLPYHLGQQQMGMYPPPHAQPRGYHPDESLMGSGGMTMPPGTGAVFDPHGRLSGTHSMVSSVGPPQFGALSGSVALPAPHLPHHHQQQQQHQQQYAPSTSTYSQKNSVSGQSIQQYPSHMNSNDHMYDHDQYNLSANYRTSMNSANYIGDAKQYQPDDSDQSSSSLFHRGYHQAIQPTIPSSSSGPSPYQPYGYSGYHHTTPSAASPGLSGPGITTPSTPSNGPETPTSSILSQSQFTSNTNPIHMHSRHPSIFSSLSPPPQGNSDVFGTTQTQGQQQQQQQQHQNNLRLSSVSYMSTPFPGYAHGMNSTQQPQQSLGGGGLYESLRHPSPYGAGASSLAPGESPSLSAKPQQSQAQQQQQQQQQQPDTTLSQHNSTSMASSELARALDSSNYWKPFSGQPEYPSYIPQHRQGNPLDPLSLLASLDDGRSSFQSGASSAAGGRLSGYASHLPHPQLDITSFEMPKPTSLQQVSDQSQAVSPSSQIPSHVSPVHHIPSPMSQYGGHYPPSFPASAQQQPTQSQPPHRQPGAQDGGFFFQ